jgi:hypothetical protein
MTRVLKLVSVLVIIAVFRAQAQDVAAPVVGSRVKVYAPMHEADTIVAVAIGYASETLTLRQWNSGDTLAVPYSAIACLHVRHTHAHVIRGVATGLLLGGALGAVTGSVSAPCGAHTCGADGDRIVRGMAQLGVVGGVVGLVVGVVARTDSWDTVPVSRLRPLAPGR